MKILFLIARYFPYSGLQTDFLRAAEAAADRGHDVTCLVGMWEGKRPDNLRILTADLPGTGEADAKSMLDILSLALAENAVFTIKAEGPDAGEALEALQAFLEKPGD